MLIIAIGLMFLVVPFQVLGSVDTCTQGAPDSFAMGAFVSSPMLLIVTIAILLKWLKLHRIEGYTWVDLGCLMGLMLASGMVLAINSTVWVEVIFGGGHPCGPDFASSTGDFMNAIFFIVFAYGIWPFLIGMGVLGLLIKDWRRRFIKSG